MKIYFGSKMPEIPEGKFLARLVDYKDVYTSFGKMGIRLVFNVIQGKFKNTKVAAVIWLERDSEGRPYIVEGSDFERWVKILNGGKLDKEKGVDVKNWIDKEVIIEVKHQMREKDGKIFANIVDIFKYSPDELKTREEKNSKENKDQINSKVKDPEELEQTEDIEKELDEFFNESELE